VHDLIWQVTTALPPAQLAAHVDLVLRTLEHTDARVREWAVGAFSHLSAALEPTIATAVAPRASAALEVLLKDEDRRVRERATALIAKMAAAEEEAAGAAAARRQREHPLVPSPVPSQAYALAPTRLQRDVQLYTAPRRSRSRLPGPDGDAGSGRGRLPGAAGPK
jgi:hypothetical protein